MSTHGSIFLGGVRRFLSSFVSPLLPAYRQLSDRVHASVASVVNPKPTPIQLSTSSTSASTLLSFGGAVASRSSSTFNYSISHPITKTAMIGLRENPKKIKFSSENSRVGLFRQAEADTRAFVFNAVVRTTKSTYASAQKLYVLWTSYLGTNPTLTVIPQEWWETCPHQHSFKITVLAGYLGTL